MRVEAAHRGHGAEGLVGHDACIGGNVQKNGRRKEIARPFGRRAAKRQYRAARDGVLGQVEVEVVVELEACVPCEEGHCSSTPRRCACCQVQSHGRVGA